MDFLEKDIVKQIKMNKKASKKLRKLALAMAMNTARPEASEEEVVFNAKRIYGNLKTVHRDIKKAPR